MGTKIYWIDCFSAGKVGITAKPDGGNRLEDEIKNLSAQHVDTLISLLEEEEIKELELEEEENCCRQFDIEFIHFPIRDFGVPDDIAQFNNLIDEIGKRLRDGEKIVIHCRMGIGRSSLLAAGILVRCGMEATKAFGLISTARNVKVPETQEQIDWVKNLKS